jgi:four helix bundle protein
LLHTTILEKRPQEYADRAFQFACQIIQLFNQMGQLSSVPSHIGRQLLRSGTSIGANLEEAKAAQSRRDLISRFSIALKEARETKYWLRLIRATRLASPRLIDPPLNEVDQIVAILTVTLRRLRDG